MKFVKNQFKVIILADTIAKLVLISIPELLRVNYPFGQFFLEKIYRVASYSGINTLEYTVSMVNGTTFMSLKPKYLYQPLKILGTAKI